MGIGFQQKKVSVIIPTFNRARFLPNAVMSIIAQKYDNIEIIIVDDGSDDNTREIVNSLKKEYPFINYYLNERTKGPSGARNTGIIKSSGEYVAFLDSDDVWLDGQLKKRLDILEKYPEIDVIFGNFICVDFFSGNEIFNFFDQKKILHTLNYTIISQGVKMLNDNLFLGLIRENFLHLGSTIVRKSILNGILLDESIIFSEDRDFGIQLYKRAKATFAFCEDPIFILYKHDSNLYNTVNRDNIKQIESHLYLFKKYLRTYHLSVLERRLLFRLIINRLLILSYAYCKKKEYRHSILYILKSFKFICLSIKNAIVHNFRSELIIQNNTLL
ncbi:MAG: glycosyltransferase family 2 protein [Cytophagaceae bacterium]